MIPTQSLETYPIFSSNGTKIQPGDAKMSAGFQQADVLPAEWMNWAWNKNSKGIQDLNDGLGSVEKEINTVLSEANISPNASNNDQLYKAVQKNNGCIITAAGTPTTITGAPEIESGNVIKIMFGADVTGSDETTGLLISYNGSNKPVKVSKAGVLVDLCAHQLGSSLYKYIQANNALEFVYDGVNFVIIGNPVVIKNTDYTIYADGSVGNEPVGTLGSFYRQLAPYGWLPCDGSQFDQNKYPALYTLLGSQNHTPDYRETAIVGIGQSTDGNVVAHDVFTLGQIKDDQLQTITGAANIFTAGGAANGAFSLTNNTGTNVAQVNVGTRFMTLNFNSGNSARSGTVTRGKRRGALICIKAL